jgi:hypothetical protein
MIANAININDNLLASALGYFYEMVHFYSKHYSPLASSCAQSGSATHIQRSN